MTARAVPPPPLTPYQKRLFLFLGVATFFDGYDLLALTQLLSNLRVYFSLSRAEAGVLVGVINLGTVLAFFLVRQADRIGRRRLLMITIVGYAVFSFLSGLAPTAWAFAFAQLIARIFLIAEWSTSMVYAAEEFPAARRGMVIGVIQASSSLGAICCAAIVPALLQTRFGWRTVYFVGALPLLVLAYARRNIRETQRFLETCPTSAPKRSLGAIFSTPYRSRVLRLALIWALTYTCTHNATAFWKEFATSERGLTDGQVGTAVATAALFSMPVVFASGKLLDWAGRRLGAAIIFVTTILGVFFAYALHGRAALTAALVFGIAGTSAVLPALNTYTTELFPTDLRGDAFGWANNILGRIGYVTSPIIVGFAAETFGWGPVMQVTVLGPLVALALILLWLPETKGRELEETCQLTHDS